MILSDFLKESNEQFFYIGAKDGSGFFAMGKKEDIADELKYQERRAEVLAEQRLRKANIDSKEAAEHMAKVYKQRIEKCENDLKDLRRQELATRSTREKKRIRDYMHSVVYKKKYNITRYNLAIQKIEQFREKAIRARGEAVHRKTYDEREVCDSYRTIAHEPAGLIVIVEGNEHAKYWDMQEYERGER